MVMPWLPFIPAPVISICLRIVACIKQCLSIGSTGFYSLFYHLLLAPALFVLVCLASLRGSFNEVFADSAVPAFKPDLFLS